MNKVIYRPLFSLIYFQPMRLYDHIFKDHLPRV
jgi:hypothetical protein